MTFEKNEFTTDTPLHLDVDHMESMHASAEQIEAAQAEGLEFTPYFQSEEWRGICERKGLPVTNLHAPEPI